MPLTDEQRLEIDVKLPPEVWAYEGLDELLAALFRLTYATGFQDGLRTPPRRPAPRGRSAGSRGRGKTKPSP